MDQILDDKNGKKKIDKAPIGWQILAFLVPIAGLVMSAYNSEYPNKAARYKMLVIISVVLGLIINFTIKYWDDIVYSM